MSIKAGLGERQRVGSLGALYEKDCIPECLGASNFLNIVGGKRTTEKEDRTSDEMAT